MDRCNPDGVVPLLQGIGDGLTDLALVSPTRQANLASLKAVRDACKSLVRLELRFEYGLVGTQSCVGCIAERNDTSLQTLALSADTARLPIMESRSQAFPDVRCDVEATGDDAPQVLGAFDGKIVKLYLFEFDEVAATAALAVL